MPQTGKQPRCLFRMFYPPNALPRTYGPGEGSQVARSNRMSGFGMEYQIYQIYHAGRGVSGAAAARVRGRRARRASTGNSSRTSNAVYLRRDRQAFPERPGEIQEGTTAGSAPGIVPVWKDSDTTSITTISAFR